MRTLLSSKDVFRVLFKIYLIFFFNKALLSDGVNIGKFGLYVNYFFLTRCCVGVRCVMVENSDIVKGDGETSIVVYGTDICDLPGLKRHI